MYGGSFHLHHAVEPSNGSSETVFQQPYQRHMTAGSVDLTVELHTENADNHEHERGAQNEGMDSVWAAGPAAGRD